MESKSCQDQNSSTIKSYQSLAVFYTNADNLINKRNELYHSLTSVKPEIIFITEILPKMRYYLLMIASFKFKVLIVLQTTTNQCHRGVLIYTKKCLKAVAVNFSELDY